VAAALRHDGALHRWFLDPTFGRGYPADVATWYEAHGFLDGIDPEAVRAAEPIDFLAVNYYRRERVVDAPVRDGWGIGSAVLEDGGERSGNGWEVWPDGLREVLVRVRDDYAPSEMAVTENGATYDDPAPVGGTVADEPRRSYLERHLLALADARDAGVPVEAYFVWSLFDNFEWAEGYAKRFGVVHVDFATQARTVKASGRFYADVLRRTAG
jgi:beta-glucosidase